MGTTDRITKIPEVDGLAFDDSTHTYRLDGLVIPSVSAIMEPLSKAKYSRISEKTLDKAANKGTSVHNSIENWIKFEITDVPLEHMGYFDAFMKWWGQYQPVVVGSEVRLCHRLMRYGGTGDLVAYIDGELNLVDFKTTYTISDMTCGIQLEGYVQALASMGVKIERKRILHLMKDGRFDLREYPINDQTRWRVFGALKMVYDYIETSG